MLIEPTETENKDTLDQFIATMRSLTERAKSGDTEYFEGAPYHTRAAGWNRCRPQTVLRWRPQPETKAAAE